MPIDAKELGMHSAVRDILIFPTIVMTASSLWLNQRFCQYASCLRPCCRVASLSLASWPHVTSGEQ